MRTNLSNQELLPTWTNPGYWRLGRDPLGIQATSVRMYRTLIPGLTNVTNRLRYYSYYCWVVALWAKVRHADDELEWYKFIRRAEALFALACESVESNTPGLAGSEWARIYWAKLKGSRIDLAPHTNRPGEPGQYLMAKKGNFGQFYVASMKEVELLEDTSTSIPIVTEAGQNLADAFSQAITEQVSSQLSKAVNSGQLSTSILQVIGNAIHPSRLISNSREMRLLREFLWPKSLEITGSEARRTSAWLLLDIAQKGFNIFDEISLRHIFYQRVLPDGQPYVSEGKIIDRWRAYHANELCHISLEVFLNAMATRLNEQVDGVDPNKLVGDIVKLFITTKERKTLWSKWAKATHNDSEESLLSIEVLEGLKRYKERAKDPKVLNSAAKLLAVLWARWSDGTNNLKGEIAQFAVLSRISLAGVFSTLDESSNLSVEEALAAVLRRHVIAEHLAIAGRKLSTGKYTYRFVFEDGTLSNGWPTEYGYTNPRLGNLAVFLMDAKLVDTNSVITTTGLKLLNDYQPS